MKPKRSSSHQNSSQHGRARARASKPPVEKITVQDQKEPLSERSDMDGSIMIYDLHGIRDRRRKADQIKQDKCRIKFRTRPYMQEVEGAKERFLQAGDEQYKIKKRMIQSTSAAKGAGEAGQGADWWRQALKNSSQKEELAEHVNRWHLGSSKGTHPRARVDPVIPGFGYPLIDYKLNPLQECSDEKSEWEPPEGYPKSTKMVQTFQNFEELGIAQMKIADFEKNQVHYNWKRATSSASAMRLQIYERCKLEQAFEIIDASFTHGAKIQRDPISEEEAKRKELEDLQEEQQFAMFKRAWCLRYKKRPSISGYILEDKHPFDIDWTENASIKASKAEEKRRKLQNRSNWMRPPSSQKATGHEAASSALKSSSIHSTQEQVAPRGAQPEALPAVAEGLVADISDHALERKRNQTPMMGKTSPKDDLAGQQKNQTPSIPKDLPEHQTMALALAPELLDAELKAEDEVIIDKYGDDLKFDQKGYGMLNPHKKYQKRSDEEVNLSLVKQRSHVAFSFHHAVPADFNRATVLPKEQMKQLRALAAKIRKRKLEIERRKNQKAYIVAEILDEIIASAQDQLFNTPVPSEIPTDSFAEDFEPEFFIKTHQDLSLKSLGSMNKETNADDATTVVSSMKKQRHQKSSDNKSARTRSQKSGVKSALQGKSVSRSVVQRSLDRKGRRGSRSSGRSGALPAAKGIVNQSYQICHVRDSQTTNLHMSNLGGEQSLLNRTVTQPGGSVGGDVDLTMTNEDGVNTCMPQGRAQGQHLSSCEKHAHLKHNRGLRPANTIELIGEFKRSKNQVISDNMQHRDWTEIFRLRQKSAAFTLEQMVKEKQQLHEQKLKAMERETVEYIDYVDDSALKSFETATDHQPRSTENTTGQQGFKGTARKTHKSPSRQKYQNRRAKTNKQNQPQSSTWGGGRSKPSWFNQELPVQSGTKIGMDRRLLAEPAAISEDPDGSTLMAQGSMRKPPTLNTRNYDTRAAFEEPRPTMSQRLKQQQARRFKHNSNISSPSRSGAPKLQMKPEPAAKRSCQTTQKPKKDEQDIVNVLKSWQKQNAVDVRSLLRPGQRLVSSRPRQNDMFFATMGPPSDHQPPAHTPAHCITIDYNDSTLQPQYFMDTIDAPRTQTVTPGHTSALKPEPAARPRISKVKQNLLRQLQTARNSSNNPSGGLGTSWRMMV